MPIDTMNVSRRILFIRAKVIGLPVYLSVHTIVSFSKRIRYNVNNAVAVHVCIYLGFYEAFIQFACWVSLCHLHKSVI